MRAGGVKSAKLTWIRGAEGFSTEPYMDVRRRENPNRNKVDELILPIFVEDFISVA